MKTETDVIRATWYSRFRVKTSREKKMADMISTRHMDKFNG